MNCIESWLASAPGRESRNDREIWNFVVKQRTRPIAEKIGHGVYRVAHSLRYERLQVRGGERSARVVGQRIADVVRADIERIKGALLRRWFEDSEFLHLIVQVDQRQSCRVGEGRTRLRAADGEIVSARCAGGYGSQAQFG